MYLRERKVKYFVTFFTAVFLVCEIFLNYARIPGFPFTFKYVPFFFVVVSIFFYAIAGYDFKFNFPKPLNILALLFLSLFLYNNGIDFYNGIFSFQTFIESVKIFIYPLLLLYTFLLAARFEILNVRVFLFLYVLLVSFSSIFAVGQWFGIDIFWKARELFLRFSESEIANQVVSRERPMGLSAYAIHLSYQVIPAVGLVLAMLENKVINFERALVILFPLYFSAIASRTKSLAVALVFLSALYIVFSGRLKSHYKKGLAVLLLLVVAVGILSVSEDSPYKLFRMDSSAKSKFPLAVVGCMVFYDNMFGIGSGNYGEYAVKYYDIWSDELRQGNRPMESPHNYFVNCMVKYGILGVLAPFLMLYVLVFVPEKYENKMILLITVSAYYLNGLVHNGGPFMKDHIFPVFIVGIIYIDKFMNGVTE